MAAQAPRFGMVLGIAPIPELVRRTRTAERGNFDFVCYYDHTLFWSLKEHNAFELWTMLSMLAKETSRVKLTPLVTDCLRRHPSIVAQATLTLDQISKGRAVLALGSGSPINLDPYGIAWEKPVTKLREAIRVIKMLWTASASSPANFEGQFFRLENAFLQVDPVQKPHPPLYQSGFGPSSRKMAGELADGFLTGNESPRMLQESLRDVEAGAKTAGRRLADLNILIDIATAVSEDGDTARQAVEGAVKQDVASQPFQRRRLGIKDDSPAFKFLDEFRRTGMKGISHDRLLQAVKEAAQEIPFDLVKDLAISGTVDDCIEQIERFRKAGARTFLLENCGPDIRKTEKLYVERIIPYFRKEERSR